MELVLILTSRTSKSTYTSLVESFLNLQRYTILLIPQKQSPGRAVGPVVGFAWGNMGLCRSKNGILSKPKIISMNSEATTYISVSLQNTHITYDQMK